MRGDSARWYEREIRVDSVLENAGIAGDKVLILGANLPADGVRFGGADALITGFDDVAREFLEVVVPLEIAGEVEIQVKDFDGKFQGDVPFRPLPGSLRSLRRDWATPQPLMTPCSRHSHGIQN